MPKKSSKDIKLIEIEETQAALRDCIEQVKELVEDSERLMRQHREEIIEAKPPIPMP